MIKQALSRLLVFRDEHTALSSGFRQESSSQVNYLSASSINVNADDEEEFYIFVACIACIGLSVHVKWYSFKLLSRIIIFEVIIMIV